MDLHEVDEEAGAPGEQPALTRSSLLSARRSWRPLTAVPKVNAPIAGADGESEKPS